VSATMSPRCTDGDQALPAGCAPVRPRRLAGGHRRRQGGPPPSVRGPPGPKNPEETPSWRGLPGLASGERVSATVAPAGYHTTCCTAGRAVAFSAPAFRTCAAV